VITSWILDLIADVWEAFLGAIPVPSEDSWVSDISGSVSWVATTLSGLGAWIPFSLLGAVLGTVAVVWGVAVGIRIGRMVLSLFTGGGGA
jgi:hypothetical protein